MAFTAKDVKNLREQTGCGMMDCKKALTESEGDFEKAVEYLREKGLAAVFGKGEEVGSLNIAVEELSLLITNFGYETQDIPMLPMGAAENALDMKVVREILNRGE